jgi:hypothetical protein
MMSRIVFIELHPRIQRCHWRFALFAFISNYPRCGVARLAMRSSSASGGGGSQP